MNAAVPIEKLVVLVGAGNAHLKFVRQWAMRPAPGVGVTLVNPAGVIPYSAMVPGHIGGEYSRDEASIDLVRLCSAAGVRLVRERIVRIDPELRRVHFAERVPMSYDVLSLGLGSFATRLGNGPLDMALRPMGDLIDGIDRLEQRLRSGESIHLAVVGGGASGSELALAIQRRFAPHTSFRLTLIHAGPRLIPTFPARASRLMLAALTRLGVEVRLNERVTSREGIADVVLWATDATPPDVLRTSGLACDVGGFLRVGPTLQSVSHPEVFGTGDCVAFDALPTLPRNGVHAVRQGEILMGNVFAFLREQPLKPYRPQSVWLSLLNTADGSAILSYGPFSFQTRWARWLKDRIDRRWMSMFEPRPMKPDSPGHLMRCGGCGAKVSGDVLRTVLRQLDIPTHPRVLVGCKDGEDAAVLGPESAEGTVEVQTVDYFKSFIDDPYLFGRVAALHAVSDLYAMNARPYTALAVATLPFARGPVQEAQLHELLAGATLEFRRLGIALAGGHTSEGHELALGFAVTGSGERATLFRKGGLRPGDALILTKPLGSGALLAAWMRGQCRAAWLESLLDGLLTPNRDASLVLADVLVMSCTDVTGFGLAGHLLEMLDASGVGATLDPGAIPLYSGFSEVVSSGVVSTLHGDNAKLASRLAMADPPAWLFDPQTSGGLLAGVASDRVDEVLRRIPGSRWIGRVEPVGGVRLSEPRTK